MIKGGEGSEGWAGAWAGAETGAAAMLLAGFCRRGWTVGLGYREINNKGQNEGGLEVLLHSTGFPIVVVDGREKSQWCLAVRKP